MSYHSPKPFPYSSSIPIFPLFFSPLLPSTLLYSPTIHFTPFSYSTPLHTTYHPSLHKPTPLLFLLHFTSPPLSVSITLLFLFSSSSLSSSPSLCSLLLFPSLSLSLSLCVSVSVFLAFSLSLNYLIHPSIFFFSFHLLLHTYFSLSLLLPLLPTFLIRHHLLLLLVLLLAHPPHPYFTLLLMCLSLPPYSLLSSILFLVCFHSSWYLLLLG